MVALGLGAFHARFGEGWEPHTVAHILDKDERTILSYFQRYQDGGIDQLLQSNYDGKEPKLTAKQEQELSEHLRNHIYHRALLRKKASVANESHLCYTKRRKTR